MNWIQLLSPRRIGQKKQSSEQSRSAFEQDYDRIIFSHPFRRLQDKTQVHPLPEHDFVHTRLTHSLEVSSVGRSLGKKVGEIILQRHKELNEQYSLFDFGAIVAAASLTHDLGNPPFGHAGEDAISDFFVHNDHGKIFQGKVSESEWSDLIKFEGNAQGFRILNKNQYGLKLTYATLGAFTKYPCSSSFSERDKFKKSQKKFGFFQTEKVIFEEVATEIGLRKVAEGAWLRHPLAFLVEAADDICYSIIDLEDACSLGLVSFEETVSLLANILREGFNRDKLDRLHGQHQKIGTLRALVISKLIDECTQIFLDHEMDILSGKFDQALTDQCASRDGLKSIIELSIEKIYRARHVVEIETAGHEILPGLLKEFVAAGVHLWDIKSAPRKYQNIALLLPGEIRFDLQESAADHYRMLRLVIDFVSGLTDRHALGLYRQIKGFGKL
ncbi:MAG TPA: deoxyguanosinetriphosphate triphosphohydrolase [Cyclobacteriaceae bacterium]|nr:deoxyguanosinetriphosphate triphosphohydrolase [Cyclobacteriaceae bacterium]